MPAPTCLAFAWEESVWQIGIRRIPRLMAVGRVSRPDPTERRAVKRAGTHSVETYTVSDPGARWSVGRSLSAAPAC